MMQRSTRSDKELPSSYADLKMMIHKLMMIVGHIEC